MPLKERIAITLYVCGAILVAFISAFAQHGFSVDTLADSIGFAIGTLFIPTVIAYAVHGRFRKRPNNHLGFARWLWWSTFILAGISASNYRREHMTTADVHTVLKQAAEMTPDSAIDNSGKSPEKIEQEGHYRDLMRSYFKEITDKRSVLDSRRAAIDTKLDGIYQPESYKPARAKAIIAALNDSIALDNDLQIWANDIVPAFQARVRQSGLTNSEQQSTLRGFQNSVSSSQLWPTLHTYLATDVELDQVSIQFYQAILKGNTEQANSYIDRIQALGKKDTDLAAQVDKLRSAGLKQAGFDGNEKAFQKTSGQ
jgi:hypothetical protein